MRALLSRICFVWFVFCGLRANEKKEKRKKYASEREHQPTNQATRYYICSPKRQSSFLSSLESLSLSLKSLSLSKMCGGKRLFKFEFFRGGF